MVFAIWWYRVSHTHSCGFISFQNTRKFCFIFVGYTTPTIFQSFAGHSRSHWCFQLLTRVLDGFLEFLILRVDEMKFLTIFVRCQDESFARTTFASPSAWRASHWFPRSSGHRWSGLDVSCFLVNLHPKSVGRFFIQWSKLCETCPRMRQVSRAINIPIIIDALLLFDIQIRMRSSGYVNVFQWNREWFFSRRVKFDSGSTWWRYMKLPDMDQKSFIASPTSGSESWGCGRDPSDSPRKSILLSPWIGRCRIGVDVLKSWSPPRGLIRPSAIGKINCPSLGNITSFALSLFELISDVSIVSNSSRSPTSTSPFQIPTA